MNEVAFNKAIKKLILPKFPWLVDYEVVVDRDDSINDYPDKGEYYRVNYFFDSDWDASSEYGYYRRREVRDLTKTLFMALGFDKDQKLEGVEFYNINHK
jgi:hypothetical protein